MRTLIVLIIFKLLLLNTLVAQEICNNCIDDDGDGLIDCYDSDCKYKANCGSPFYGQDSIPEECKTLLTPNIMLSELWRSEFPVNPMFDNRYASNTPIVGDIDNDNIPEVIGLLREHDNTTHIVIISGATGEIEDSIKIYVNSDYWAVFKDGITIGDVDNDGFGEIFCRFIDYSVPFPYRGDIYCFEHDLTLKWQITASPGMFYTYYNALLNLADFNADGIPELYEGNNIYNAQTGALLINGNGSLGRMTSPLGNQARPVAADILDFDATTCPDCDGLELIAGNEVYGIDIPNNTMTLRAQAPSNLLDGFTAVADFNKDGQADIIVNQKWHYYVWNPITEDTLVPRYTFQGDNGGPSGSYAGHGGPPLVGNFDADPELEIVAIGTDFMVLIDNDMTARWRHKVTESGSIDGTGVTAFDFDCDEVLEIVYRSATHLYIINGEDGTTLDSVACASGTATESPTVVDVNNDGHAEILCNCSTDSTTYTVTYGSPTNDWPVARKVRNQTNFFNVHIQDNLTITCNQPDHTQLDNINQFNAAANLVDENGNQVCQLGQSDMVVMIDSIYGACGLDSVTATITFCNKPYRLPVDSFFVSVYTDNPLNGGLLIKTVKLDSFISHGNCVSKTLIVPNGPYNLYAVVNDNGINPSNAPITNFPECDENDNMDFLSIPEFTTSVFDLSPTDTTLCPNDSVTLNASGGTSYLWHPPELFGKDTLSESVTITPDSSLEASVIISDSTLNCSDTLKSNIVLIQTTLKASPDTLTVKNAPIELNAESEASVIWSSNGFIECPTCHSTIVSTEESTWFYVNTEQCMLKDSVFVKIVDYFIPNVFTPLRNNENSTFSPLLHSKKQISSYIFSIYNKYGEQVFTTNDPSMEWDGSIYAREKAHVFTYYLDVKYEGGLNYIKTGNVTMLL